MPSHPTAIITGAGRGIGRATAVQLAKHGYRLALVSRTESEIAETARLCGNALPLKADVSVKTAVESVVKTTLKKFGSIDALVHNAGLAPMKPMETFTDEEWRAVLDTNLSAAFYFCRALWPVWRKQKSGTIVLVSSQAARNPFIGLSIYGAAKAAINNFGLSLAREGAPIGIRAHVVAPGAVETGMLRAIITPEQLPAERTLKPEDVASVIVQCVRGELPHCSGEVIYVQKSP